MEDGFDLSTAARAAFTNILDSIIDIAPRAVTTIVIVLLGVLVAKLLERLVRTAFDRLKIDDAFERLGLTSMFRRIGWTESPGRLFGRVVYFLVIIVVTQAVTEAVGLTTISGAIAAFVAYLPRVVAALLILVLGTLVAQVASRAVASSARGSGIEYAPLLGRLVSALVLFVVVIMAFTQLRIETDIVRSIFLVLIGGGAIALALSFGIGTRDVTRNLVAGMYARKLFDVGDEIEVAGERGVLAGIMPIQTLIDRDGETIVVPNGVFIEETVKQKPAS